MYGRLMSEVALLQDLNRSCKTSQLHFIHKSNRRTKTMICWRLSLCLCSEAEKETSFWILLLFFRVCIGASAGFVELSR